MSEDVALFLFAYAFCKPTTREKHPIDDLILDPLSVTEEPHSGLALKRFKGREPVHADVAKLVDARDLKSLGENCTGSIPVVRTTCRSISNKPIDNFPTS